MLGRWIEASGRRLVAVREPGGTAVGEAIRHHVWVRPDLEIDALTELLLVSAARSALVGEVIRPALAEGAVVLADRFALSTLAYQGYGRGLSLETIREVTGVATGDTQPDLYLVLEVPDDAGTERQRAAGMTADRMEREGSEFMARVQSGYRELAARETGIEVVDGLGEIDTVQQRLRDTLLARFPGHFQS